ncbi:sigma-70 family RNA polymerase sigma factor [Opitutus sp. ER46]|uniref:sigma-70 family RNA polymerase sigma factor n=1 Tax=Opitutus sp. ER46 TaxID=2161864 RepID=UPI001304BDE7|nr:sigma-70 family RNA polymerase sigma factor [Opitutus sp. ER46]
MATFRERILEVARTLPPAPRVFAELDRLLRDANSGLDEIAALIKRDATLVGHVIRVSNSTVYGGEQPTGSVEEAVVRVGFQEVFRIVGQVAMSRLAERPLRAYGVDADRLRELMLHTAFLCEHLATECGIDPRSAYTAGLMRPLGLLILDRLADRHGHLEVYNPAEHEDYEEWEGRVFGLSSAEVAALVLDSWSFPQDIVQAIRAQYLVRSEDLTLRFACLLNLASGVAAEQGQGLPGELCHWTGQAWKLETLGLTETRFNVAVARAQDAYAAFRGRLLPEDGSQKPEAGGQRPEAGGQKTDVGDQMSEVRSRKPEAGSRRPDDGNERPEGGSQRPETEGRALVAELPAAGLAKVEASAIQVDPQALPENRNFATGPRVLGTNDGPPVQSSTAAPAELSQPETTEPVVAAVSPPADDFTTFMRNYQDMVYSTAARVTGNDAQAEDIAQEVFLKAYENFDQLRQSPTAGGWLKTVATNLSINHLSRYRNRWRFFSEFRRSSDAGDEDEAPMEFAAPDNFFANLDAADRRELVDRALAQLPEHQRVPLVLYHFEDMPYDEIARKLRVSLAKVKTDILRARAALAKILQRSGTAHEQPSY